MTFPHHITLRRRELDRALVRTDAIELKLLLRLLLDADPMSGRYIGRLSNWQWFANEAGVRWYCTFRSLIASCHLHGLNAQIYLEQLIRLIPHWPTTKVLALSPRYWRETNGHADARAARHHHPLLGGTRPPSTPPSTARPSKPPADLAGTALRVVRARGITAAFLRL